MLAAAILVIQGLSTLFYATFLPAPLSQAGIDVPALGTMPFTWIALGGIAIVAGVGVAARLTGPATSVRVSAVLDDPHRRVRLAGHVDRGPRLPAAGGRAPDPLAEVAGAPHRLTG